MTELALTVFVASVLGSVHCAGMCGPFVALTSLRRTSRRTSLVPKVATTAIAYNAGRGVAYVGIGALAGALGWMLDGGGALAGMQRGATTLAGLSMVVIGVVWMLDLLSGRRAMGQSRGVLHRVLVEKLRAGMGAAGRSFRPVPRSAVLGVLTSLMPCGWLYAFAITAAGTGSPLRGAVLMGAFWAGNVPILMLLGTGLHRFGARLGRAVPLVMAVLIIAVGSFTALHRAAIPLPARDPGPHVSESVNGGPAAMDLPTLEAMPCHAP